MSVGRKPEDDFFAWFDQFIRRVQEVLDHQSHVVAETSKRLVIVLRTLINFLGRLFKSFVLIVCVRGGWQLCRAAGMSVFVVFLGSIGIELILTTSTVMQILGWLI